LTVDRGPWSVAYHSWTGTASLHWCRRDPRLKGFVSEREGEPDERDRGEGPGNERQRTDNSRLIRLDKGLTRMMLGCSSGSDLSAVSSHPSSPADVMWVPPMSGPLSECNSAIAGHPRPNHFQRNGKSLHAFDNRLAYCEKIQNEVDAWCD
jgi:hypothetical protein